VASDCTSLAGTAVRVRQTHGVRQTPYELLLAHGCVRPTAIHGIRATGTGVGGSGRGLRSRPPCPQRAARCRRFRPLRAAARPVGPATTPVPCGRASACSRLGRSAPSHRACRMVPTESRGHRVEAVVLQAMRKRFWGWMTGQWLEAGWITRSKHQDHKIETSRSRQQ